MQSFGLIVVGPIWGLISAQLFLQTGEEFIKAVFFMIGFFKGKVSTKKTLPRMLLAIAKSLICAVLLIGGFWLICVRYPGLRTDAQDVLYLAFAVLSAIYIISRMPYNLHKAWNQATVPGAIEDDAQEEAQEKMDSLGAHPPKAEEPKSSAETPGDTKDAV